MSSVLDALLKAGFDRRAGRLTAAVLGEADASGHLTHGSALVPDIEQRLLEKRVRPDVYLTAFDTGTAVLGIDGHGTIGYATASVATRLAIARAQTDGIGGCVIRSVDHVGALGVYARRAARANCISFITASGRPRVAPWGCSTAAFGTTPICIGIPNGSNPIIFDSSLTIATVRQIMDSLPSGRIAPGMAEDSLGAPTTSPEAALAGRLKPIGGHKGAGLMLALNVLAHYLANSDASDHPVIIGMLRADGPQTRPLAGNHFFQILQEIVIGEPTARMPGTGTRAR